MWQKMKGDASWLFSSKKQNENSDLKNSIMGIKNSMDKTAEENVWK